jgi:hypothetical protein
MPTTRSANKQAKLEDVGAGRKDLAQAESTGQKAGQKRKATQGSDKPKKPKQAKQDDGSARQDEGVITINRAPVLELWGSCVAQFLHPSVSWETCLSAGSAVATIVAISKGRSVGTIAKPDPGEAQKKREERKAKAKKENLDDIEVMSFHLNLDKNGQAMVGDKPKKAGEEALMKKYGGPEHYDQVRNIFQDALKSWRGREEELDKHAFGFYEDFRPSVPQGSKGWGRKGQLRLDTIRTVIGDG